ncbi:MAG: GntR family transcriptional regulator [Desulfobacteraceae bacterium]|nr:GntR family transcriptional regulator [Desulfobacteraceae bacterium]
MPSDVVPPVEEPASALNYKSLREQVYEFLRAELHSGRLLPGSAINLSVICSRLGISKTPLRDALLQLDTEGFVTISPRRGVFVNKLTLEDIRHSYEIVGALEAAVITSVFDSFKQSHLEKMRWVNSNLRAALEREDFENYYQLNIAFHRVFHDLSDNVMLQRIITPIQQRLYDFPRRGYLKGWELSNCEDHQVFIEAVEKRDLGAAIDVWQNVHWSFNVYESYIRQFYFCDES